MKPHLRPAMAVPGSRFPRHAFTLVELLVTLAILAVLAGLLLPAATRATARARGTACLSQLRQLGLSLRLYLDDHDNRFPTMVNRASGPGPVPSNAVEVVLGPHLGNPAVLRCPADRQRVFEESGSSYFWNFLLNGQRADHPRVMGLDVRADGIPLFSDKEPFHAGRGEGRGKNHLYSDGAVRAFVVLETAPKGGLP